MTDTQTIHKTIIAFDVAKQKLDICTDDRLKVPKIVNNTVSAIRKILAAAQRKVRQQSLPELLVIVESTGTYERKVLDLCVALEIRCHRAHSNNVYHFARARGLLAKTDKLDAATIWAYGKTTPNLRLYVPPRPAEEKLHALMMRRDEIKNMVTAEGNRLGTVHDKDIKKSLQRIKGHLETELKRVEKQITALVESDEVLSEKFTLLRSLKGVGSWVACAALAFMPELGKLGREEAAALAGLAPYNNDSGKMRGKRRIKAGRKNFRNKLYMGAVSASTHNIILRPFGERLVAKGKCKMLALTAIMRKMVVIMNAILKSGEPWKHAKKA